MMPSPPCLPALHFGIGSYIKDLSVVHSDLSSIVILDNPARGLYRSFIQVREKAVSLVD